MTITERRESLDGMAVIGMAGRFPGARTIAEFWRNLLAGVESISRFAPHELEPCSSENPAVRADPRYVPARGIVDDVELFDAAFFGITPKEAQILDPQQRLFLEAAWEALEQAGYAPGTHRGTVGVFAGMSNNAYFSANLEGHHDLIEAVGGLQAMMANEKDYLATRVSYKLDLRGPSLNVQTACSTSLVAVCQAAPILLGHTNDMAHSGGVPLALPQPSAYLYHHAALHPPNGRCRAFDCAA